MLLSFYPVVRAWCALAALVLILAGTAAITLGGAPELLLNIVTDENRAPITDENGRSTVGKMDEATVFARDRYMQWARPGMVVIALGMGLQSLEPIGVILDARRRRTLPRRGT